MTKWLVFLFAAFLPLSDASRYFLGAGTVSELLLVLLLAACLLAWPLRPIPFSVGQLLVFSVLVFWTVISTWSALIGRPNSDLAQAAEYVVRSIEYYLVFFAVSQSTQNTGNRRAFVKGLILGGSLEALIVLVHWTIGPGNLLFQQWGPAWAGGYTRETFRVWGTYGNPLPLTTFLITLTGILTVMALRGRRPLQRSLWTSLLALNVVAVVATGSRIGLIVLLIPIAFSLRRMSFTRLASMAALGAAIVGFVVSSGVGAVLTSRVDQLGAQDLSVWQRLKVYESTIEMMIDHPMLGVGPGQYAEVYEHRYRDPGSSLDPSSFTPENIFLLYGAERGIPAMVLLLGLIGVILVPAMVSVSQRRMAGDPSTLYVKALSLGVLCFLASSMVQTAMDAPSHILLFALLGAIDSYSPVCLSMARKSMPRSLRTANPVLSAHD